MIFKQKFLDTSPFSGKRFREKQFFKIEIVVHIFSSFDPLQDNKVLPYYYFIKIWVILLLFFNLNL
jgi:hypothetical protein